MADKLGIDSKFVDGRRVTNEQLMDAVVYSLNGEAQAAMLSCARELGFDAVGVSGVDSGLILATKRPPVKSKDGSLVDYGMVGDIERVDPTVLQHLLAGGYLPIVSPVSANEEGDLLNINADSVASAIASELGASKLILVTTVPGLLRDINDPMSVISHLDIAQLNSLEKDGILAGGMLPKATSIINAIENGVERVHIIGYRVSDSLLLEVFTNEGCGTLIVRDSKELE